MHETSDIQSVESFYDQKLIEHGVSHAAVGWGSKEDQFLRFRMLLRGISPKGKVILDAGCGLGDLVNYLDELTGGDFEYIGIDITESLIHKARDLHQRPNCTFLVGDLMADGVKEVDISILSGALTYKRKDIKGYAKKTMGRMYELSREAACLNFMSKHVDFELDKNQHYYPEEVLEWSYGLTRNITLYGDYPLYEFTIQLKKEPAFR